MKKHFEVEGMLTDRVIRELYKNCFDKGLEVALLLRYEPKKTYTSVVMLGSESSYKAVYQNFVSQNKNLKVSEMEDYEKDVDFSWAKAAAGFLGLSTKR